MTKSFNLWQKFLVFFVTKDKTQAIILLMVYIEYSLSIQKQFGISYSWL